MVVFSRISFPAWSILDGIRELFSIDSGGVGQDSMADGDSSHSLHCSYCGSFGLPVRVGSGVGYGCSGSEPGGDRGPVSGKKSAVEGCFDRFGYY